MGVNGIGNSPPDPSFPLGPTSQQLRAGKDIDTVEQSLENLNYYLDPNSKIPTEERINNVEKCLNNIKNAFLDISNIQGGITRNDATLIQSLESSFNANIPHGEDSAQELIQLYAEDPGGWGKVIGMVAGQAQTVSAELKAGY